MKGERRLSSENICKYIAETSKNIWMDSKDYYESTIDAREETFTESILLHLYRHLPKKQYGFKKFTTTQESLNGADWEWYILQGEHWIRFAVQAKKLFISESPVQRKMLYKYKYLHHDIKKNGKVIDNQCKRLLKFSYKYNYIPLYSFYNYLKEDKISKITIPPDVKKDTELLGWTYCFAENVYPTKKCNEEFNSVWKKSNTMKSLFCNTDIDEILSNYNKIQFELDDNGTKIKKTSLVKKKIQQLPPYVVSLMEENKITGNYTFGKDVKGEPISENVMLTILAPVKPDLKLKTKQDNSNRIINSWRKLVEMILNWLKVR